MIVNVVIVTIVIGVLSSSLYIQVKIKDELKGGGLI